MSNDSWFVYILFCSDATLYTGVTNNVAKRIEKHNLGTGAKYTKGRGPVSVCYLETFVSRSEAQKREHEIKALSKEKKNTLINNYSKPDKITV